MNYDKPKINSRSKRDSDLELLRIIAMIGVILLHFVNADIGGAIVFVSADNAKLFALSAVKAVFISAVDVFLMISGYFMYSKSSASVEKAIKLIIQVVFTNELLFFLRVIMGTDLFSVKHVLANLIPVNYYVIMYVALYLLAPYINKLFSILDDKKFFLLIILIFCLFSLWPTLVNIAEHIMNSHYEGLSTVSIKGDQAGYNIVCFFMCYSLGVFARRIKDKKNNRILIMAYVFSFIAMLVWYLIGTKLNKELSVYNYSNPLVICIAFSTLMLFTNLKIGSNKAINWISGLSFTVFLAHGFYLRLIPVEYICNLPLPFMIILMIVSCVLIYFACIPFYFLFEGFYKLIESVILKITRGKKAEIKL